MTTESSCVSMRNCVWAESADQCDDDSGNESGCCAGNSERSSKRCNGKQSADACNRRSSCHWIVTDDASDCEWYGEDVEVESGCCYADKVDSLAFSADLCQEYWNDNGCLVSYDANGDRNCRWQTTRDGVDCSDAVVSEAAPRDESFMLFGGDTGYMAMNQLSAAFEGDISLLSVLMVLAAMFAVYRVYSCWKSARLDGYEKIGEGKFQFYETNNMATNYQSME